MFVKLTHWNENDEPRTMVVNTDYISCVMRVPGYELYRLKVAGAGQLAQTFIANINEEEYQKLLAVLDVLDLTSKE